MLRGGGQSVWVLAKLCTVCAVTESAAIAIKLIEVGKSVLNVCLHLSIAFDAIHVDHSILIYYYQIFVYGIREIPLKLFQSYLSNRTQYVQYKRCSIKCTQLAISCSIVLC